MVAHGHVGRDDAGPRSRTRSQRSRSAPRGMSSLNSADIERDARRTRTLLATSSVAVREDVRRRAQLPRGGATEPHSRSAAGFPSVATAVAAEDHAAATGRPKRRQMAGEPLVVGVEQRDPLLRAGPDRGVPCRALAPIASWRMTDAPAASATDDVASVGGASSTTMISAGGCGRCALALCTARATRSARL